MNYTYVPLPLVEEASSVSASAQVLVIDDGEVKRTDAANIGIKPTGKLTLTNTTETDCTNYAAVQIVDANLLAENIKKDVSVLGITGAYEGGGGSSDFSTATVVIDNTNNISAVTVNVPCVLEANAMGEGSPACVYYSVYCEAGTTFTATVPLYKGSCFAYSIDVTSVTGDISAINTGLYMITGDGSLVIGSPF